MQHARAAGPVSAAGSTLYGWLVSPYTSKVRSMLAYKRIPFTDASPSALSLAFTVKPAVGRVIMPTMRLADGTWRQDSALICDEIEAAHPDSPPTKPPGAAQALASSLLELHADEWLPILALHYRWNVPGNAAWAAEEFGRCALPWAPRALATAVSRPFAAKMQSFRKVQGVAPCTHGGIEAFAAQLISTLEAHLRSHPFLLGGAACRGDFALYGPIYSHLYRDPHSRSLFDGAPHVVSWLRRLHGHATDPAFPSEPAASPPSSPPSSPGAFLPADVVPATLDPIFRALFDEQWPFLAALSSALDEVRDRRPEDTPDACRVPRALGYAPFAVGGAEGERRLVSYQAWRLQRPLDAYRALELAPARSTELASADAWLTRLGARETFRALRPKWRLQRQSELPLPQEALTFAGPYS